MPDALTGDFTPFGYLRNPSHRATSWTATSGGNLRTSAERVGLEWVYPIGRDPTARVGIDLELIADGRVYATRQDFDAVGLTSRQHTCQMISFDWALDAVRVAARCFLVDADALGVQVSAVNTGVHPRSQTLRLVARVDGREVEGAANHGCLTRTPCVHRALGDGSHLLQLGPGQEQRLTAVLARGADLTQATQRAADGLGSAVAALDRLLDEDARFQANCPSLSGDWPAHWREGLHHDFQTTRLLVQPPGGIFTDVWPSWMAAWPRVVLAEGTLDMLRLAYADPSLASRAVLSLFRDAPQPNVPCVFENGEYNMLAADGSRCGTSPAWCLPFLSLELLYLRTLDRRWLASLYPFAASYVTWWLEHRVDAEGWLVYRCTWESGEDGNPRLDPSGSGDADISGRVRPVELQATLAHAARVLASFAVELGLEADARAWRTVHDAFRERTRALFDAAQGRYRDWLIAEQRPSDACPEHPYWGVDAGRFSAQSLTPLLIGEPLPEAEIWRHATPPWTDWPSWTISLVESAAAAGRYAAIGELVFAIVDRVYRVTTRRELGSLARPLPGGAPEFWPSDWRTYAGNDAYGWGATTANLLIRHLFGFKESRQTDGWVAELTPALPAALLQPGARYAIRRLTYRGVLFDLTYTVQPGGLLAELDLAAGQPPRACGVRHLAASAPRQPDHTSTAVSSAPPQADQTSPLASAHRFWLQPGQRYTLRLE